MGYHRITDHSFPYDVQIPEATAQEIARFLISAEGMDDGTEFSIANGSSFAITAHENDGVRRLWLSMASYDRLRDDERYADLLRQALSTRTF